MTEDGRYVLSVHRRVKEWLEWEKEERGMSYRAVIPTVIREYREAGGIILLGDRDARVTMGLGTQHFHDNMMNLKRSMGMPSSGPAPRTNVLCDVLSDIFCAQFEEE